MLRSRKFRTVSGLAAVALAVLFAGVKRYGQGPRPGGGERHLRGNGQAPAEVADPQRGSGVVSFKVLNRGGQPDAAAAPFLFS